MKTKAKREIGVATSISFFNSFVLILIIFQKIFLVSTDTKELKPIYILKLSFVIAQTTEIGTVVFERNDIYDSKRRKEKYNVSKGGDKNRKNCHEKW